MIFQGLIEKACEQLPSGVFLVTGKEANPMTIGWAEWGVIWGKPVMMVMVRHSRYSHELIESGEFTVSVPAYGTMKEELRVCGSRSGRDIDKKAELGMKTVPSKNFDVPVIDGCEIYFECRTLLKTEVSMEDLDPVLLKRFYGADQKTSDGDPHTLYFGEVLAAYNQGE